MRRSRLALVRPVPYLDASPLVHMWNAGELSLGRTVPLDGREYQVVGVDPEGSGTRRVYLEELGSSTQHMLVVKHSEVERTA